MTGSCFHSYLSLHFTGLFKALLKWRMIQRCLWQEERICGCIQTSLHQHTVSDDWCLLHFRISLLKDMAWSLTLIYSSQCSVHGKSTVWCFYAFRIEGGSQTLRSCHWFCVECNLFSIDSLTPWKRINSYWCEVSVQAHTHVWPDQKSP